MRVNANNRRRAFVTVDELIKDVMLDGLPSQNCALDGDTVIIQMLPASRWPEYPKPVNGDAKEEQKSGGGGIDNEQPVETRVVDVDNEDTDSE